MEQNTKSENVRRSRIRHFVIIGICCLAVGIGIGIGIGSGIWNSSETKNESLTALEVCAEEKQHAGPLLTYVLQSSEVKVAPLVDPDAYDHKGFNGTFAEIRFNRSSLPSTVPYVMNEIDDGILFEDVLNSTQFLDDWAVLSENSGPLFAMPGEAASYQCYSKEEISANKSMSFDASPPNALIRFDNDASIAVLVDIFDVRIDPSTGEFVLIVRQAPPNSQVGVREGSCHEIQNLDTPHYHHVPICMDMILSWNIELSQLDGSGMTAFIKVVTTDKIRSQASVSYLNIANSVPQSVLSIISG
jgi:hypothetical protein